jgi:hypothetical protein
VVGGVVRWVGEPTEMRAYINQQAFQTGENITFRIWEGLRNAEFTPEVIYLAGDSFVQVNANPTVQLVVRNPDSQMIFLNQGWNQISSYISPLDLPIEQVMQELVARRHLRLVKNGIGRFWSPPYDFNNIGDWKPLEGYQVAVTAADSLTVSGLRTPPDTAIPLKTGWNLSAYLLDQPVDPQIALEGILNDLVIAKNGRGEFIAPQYGYFGIDSMSPGEGYRIKVVRDIDLVYRTGQRNAVALTPKYPNDPMQIPTGSDMSLLLIGKLNGFDLSNSAFEIHAGMNQQIAGFSRAGDLPCGVIIRGDDPFTEAADGALAGDNLTLTLRKDNRDLDLKFSILEGNLQFKEDAFTVIRLEGIAEPVPTRFVLDKTWPNPFNNRTTVRFGLAEESEVRLIVTDIQGRVVLNATPAKYTAGWHQIELDGGEWSSGVYMLQVVTPKARLDQKLVLLR